MKTKRIVLMGLLISMYVVLSLFPTLTLWNYKITFEAFPILIGAMLMGPTEGFLIGFLGSLINQLITYGITPTTVLWILPHAVSGFIAGKLANHMCGRFSGIRLFVITATSALCVTGLNTIAMYVDSKLYGYYSKIFVFGALGIRIITGIVSAFVFSFILPPVMNQLEKAGFK